MSSHPLQPAAPIPATLLVEEEATLGFIHPNGVSRCQWSVNGSLKDSPHQFQKQTKRSDILPNVLHAIGNTPMVKLNNITKKEGIKCELLAKCEFFNPGGSVKDRIAYRMVQDAEDRGLLKPGSTIIEPTSGNTGIGLAMAAAVKGYRCIIVMPLKMSDEKLNTLKAFGAEIIRTPTAAAFDSPEGLIAVSQKLCRQIPNSIILDQYRNAYNPIAHYEQTAQEIFDQCGGKIDAIICGAGTGGTISGIGRKIKELAPNCKVVGVDPLGSILAEPAGLNNTDVSFYEVEGIGYDFLPTVLDRTVVDQWYKSCDKDSLPMARRLIREEGLLCGGSSGTAMVAALDVARTMKEGERCVVLLPDGVRNYMTKFINDSWMAARNFEIPAEPKPKWWSHKSVADLELRTPKVVKNSAVCRDVVKMMKEAQMDFCFVGNDGGISGIVGYSKLCTALTNGSVTPDSTTESLLEPVRLLSSSDTLQRLAFVFEKEKCALVKAQTKGVENGDHAVYPKYVTPEDLVGFICNTEPTTK